jgi:hypothetical protein
VRIVWLMSPQTSNTESTTVVVEPYEVVLEAALDRFEDTKFAVRQHVVLGGRIVVASASGDGYWYVPAGTAPTRDGAVPRAVFQPDKTASFTYYACPCGRCQQAAEEARAVAAGEAPTDNRPSGERTAHQAYLAAERRQRAARRAAAAAERRSRAGDASVRAVRGGLPGLGKRH